MPKLPTLAVAFVFGISLIWCQATMAAEAITCRANKPIQYESFVPLGGIEQWITIKGDNCANPIILILHGGPGNPLSPFADTIFAGWSKEFTLVQWDQRGAGKTFGRNQPSEDSVLTLPRMRDDGIELAQFLTQRLGQKKVILMGSSWGSVLAVHIAQAKPELFHAYIGSAQLVHAQQNLAASYTQTLALARAAGDEKTSASLTTLGPPPWTNPRNIGILRRATRAYEAKTSTPAPPSWWQPAAAYNTAPIQAAYSAGEDYSFIQAIGIKGGGMLSTVDLNQLGSQFALPVFLLHGTQDLVTVPDIAQHYFERLSAPQKEFILIPKTGHDPNPALLEAQLALLRKRVLPLIK